MRKTIIFIGLLIIFAILFSTQTNVFAHCDTLDGPVVADAREALKKGDVIPVLKWVKKDAEPEIRAAFEKALAERKANQDAADMKFFETLVRVHRAGEGASFTGLKPSGSVEPIIAGADKALETGSVDALTQEMSEHLTNGVKERFERALETKKHKDENVEAGREYVEAYVEYVHPPSQETTGEARGGMREVCFGAMSLDARGRLYEADEPRRSQRRKRFDEGGSIKVPRATPVGFHYVEGLYNIIAGKGGHHHEE